MRIPGSEAAPYARRAPGAFRFLPGRGRRYAMTLCGISLAQIRHFDTVNPGRGTEVE